MNTCYVLKLIAAIVTTGNSCELEHSVSLVNRISAEESRFMMSPFTFPGFYSCEKKTQMADLTSTTLLNSDLCGVVQLWPVSRPTWYSGWLECWSVAMRGTWNVLYVIRCRRLSIPLGGKLWASLNTIVTNCMHSCVIYIRI